MECATSLSGHTRSDKSSEPQIVVSEDVQMAVDEIENLRFTANQLLLDDAPGSRQSRALMTVLGAMETHLQTLKNHCAQKNTHDKL